MESCSLSLAAHTGCPLEVSLWFSDLYHLWGVCTNAGLGWLLTEPSICFQRRRSVLCQQSSERNFNILGRSICPFLAEIPWTFKSIFLEYVSHLTVWMWGFRTGILYFTVVKAVTNAQSWDTQSLKCWKNKSSAFIKENSPSLSQHVTCWKKDEAQGRTLSEMN